MKVINCKVKLDADYLGGTKLDHTHYDILAGGDEPCDVYKPDGSVLVKYRPNWFPTNMCRAVMPACRAAARVTSNRGMAAGGWVGENGKTITTGKRVMADGQLAKTVIALPVNSGIIGYFDRNPRMPFCRQTSFVIQEAARWKQFMPYIQRADEGFRHYMPDRWEAQNAWVQKTSKDWIIPESTFTTVTVNRNFQTATHKDAGDLAAGFGVMSCLRNDKYDGAYLVFPAYRVAIDYAHGSLCLADVHEWHSNTPFSNIKFGYERITLVFYYRENMIYCKSAREEVELAKNRKRGEHLNG